ncbi:hypothetical protein HN419_05750 [Candidatus Woesearchaeota archaeon]|jgi:hypothetical protein|nr:hypothetical protein [Candidatus Woesearchaeota archaeon]MBT3537626.1 hypothetical protein [Candidatus Woesearchaeota archaeon]MBT4698440.1 hypothetical protein [Candidatus Woesearchaeota archaeon]MBT4716651.1 hypothetical protein [Candidatus Woesearchaeota archaeon]MBT7105295.1 hypothetical protein [Candidatus Woesearchaeota archaeon]
MKRFILVVVMALIMVSTVYSANLDHVGEIDEQIVIKEKAINESEKDYSEAVLAYELAKDKNDWMDEQEREDEVDYQEDILDVLNDQVTLLNDAKETLALIYVKEDELRDARLHLPSTSQRKIEQDLDQLIDTFNEIENDYNAAEKELKDLEERERDYSAEEYYKDQIYDTEAEIEELEDEYKEYESELSKLEVELDDAERAEDWDLRREIKDRMNEIEDEMDDIMEDLDDRRQELLADRNKLDEVRIQASKTPAQLAAEAQKISEANQEKYDAHKNKATVKITKEEEIVKRLTYSDLRSNYLKQKGGISLLKYRMYDCEDEPLDDCVDVAEDFVTKGNVFVKNGAEMIIAHLFELRDELESEDISGKDEILMKINEKITKMQVARESINSLNSDSTPEETSLAARSVRTVWRNSKLEIQEVTLRNSMNKAEKVLARADSLKEKFSKINSVFKLEGKDTSAIESKELAYEVECDQAWRHLARSEEYLQEYNIVRATESVQSAFNALSNSKTLLAEIKVLLNDLKTQEVGEDAKEIALEYARDELSKAFASGNQNEIEVARKNLVAIESS